MYFVCILYFIPGQKIALAGGLHAFGNHVQAKASPPRLPSAVDEVQDYATKWLWTSMTKPADTAHFFEHEEPFSRQF